MWGNLAVAILAAAPVRAPQPTPPSPRAERAPQPSAERSSPPAAPYSLPWQLRPVTAGTSVRSDTVLARYEDTIGNSGYTVVSALAASLLVPGTGDKGAGLAAIARLTMVQDSPPSGPG